jgi:diamine N-acetyltransferase
MPNRDSTVTLRVVNDGNVQQVIDLSVSDAQQAFVAPNVKSLAQAFASTKVWVRAAYADETPVGFLMLYEDEDKPRYYLWRFMIDERYQGMGFGRQAMDLVHERVRARPGGTTVYLTYVPANGGPEHFYKSIGYVDTGEVRGGEVEAVLELSS